MPTKLYVGNLAYSVKNDDLAQHFAQAGKVETATVVTDKFSGQSRGFGFVEMADQAEATRAVETLNDSDLKGRRIRVDEARAGALFDRRDHSVRQVGVGAAEVEVEGHIGHGAHQLSP